MVPNNPVQVDEDSIQTEVLNPQIRRFKLCVVKIREKYLFLNMKD
jgi:hypothetical protein